MEGRKEDGDLGGQENIPKGQERLSSTHYLFNIQAMKGQSQGRKKALVG